MALLSRLHWWTVEYGLIGPLDKPKIYGAGLLSSIGESVSCLEPNVKKIPYSIDAQDVPFDITTKQPQLFVTRDFQQLGDVLEEFASKMAFRVGGLEGINKAIECKNTATCEYSSGLQVSGVFTEVITHEGDADLPAHDRTQRARLREQGTARTRPRLSRGRFWRADRQLEVDGQVTRNAHRRRAGLAGNRDGQGFDGGICQRRCRQRPRRKHPAARWQIVAHHFYELPGELRRSGFVRAGLGQFRHGGGRADRFGLQRRGRQGCLQSSRA